jgi:hypothetical protein
MIPAITALTGLAGVITGMIAVIHSNRRARVTDVTRERSHIRGTVEAVTKSYQSDYIDWDAGREGYVDLPPPPVYVSVRKPASKSRAGKSSGQRYLLSISTEERLGSLIAAAGTIWATHAATIDYAGLWHFQIMPPGPLEVCALGILAWLHAKWRRSTKVD